MRRTLLRIVFLILISFAGNLSLSAQTQKLGRFSGDSTKFVGELDLLFNNLQGNEEKLTKEVMAEFLPNWNAEKYNPFQKKRIYDIGNLMLKKKLRPFPDFYNFIRALNASLKSNQTEESFRDWSKILLKLADSKYSRHFTAFVEFSIPLFLSGLIYDTPLTKWKVMDPHYSFRIDSVPEVDFTPSDLACLANSDTMFVYNTRGIFFPLSNRWKGNGGRVDWARAGLDPQVIYVTLQNYEIAVNLSKYSAENAQFFHKKYFSTAIPGQFTDKIMGDVAEERATYPRFSSYDKQLAIRNVFPNIHYLGGFAMEGGRINGYGDNKVDARLSIIKDDKEFMTLRSKVFVIRTDRISAGKASVAIYFDADSIYHPGLQMKYIEDKKELSLTKDDRTDVMSPMFDSWHKLEIYCEALYWKTTEQKINFEMMKGPNSEGRATFESNNYYSEQRYDQVQGMDAVNPLYVINNICGQAKKREISLEQLINMMQKTPESVEALMLSLSARGFVLYDEDAKRAVIKDKLFNYIKAKNNLADYDVITFNSEVKGTPNAILDLKTFDMKINGVKSVFLSDSQQVYIYPAKNEILVKKDRDFLFSGKIEAGLFDMYAKDCAFEYSKFKLDLPTIDSMGFYVRSRTKDPKTQIYPMVKVRTYLTSLSGDLLIDDPKNKSGRKYLQEYPVFNSKNDAQALWDKKSIQRGVYKKEKFFYTVYPFTFKNIARIPTDSLQFKGMLTSAGIFPTITEPLKVRPDYSLGIETTTTEQGLPAYGGKGTFFKHIDLSNEGLKGNGILTYLGSTTVSDKFIFYPDSMNTFARSFEAKELASGANYPSVFGDSLNEKWLPYQDSMVVGTVKKDFAMYNDQSRFTGNLGLTPTGLTGQGTIRIKDAEMDSKTFKFNPKTFDANIANFRIKSVNLNELSISTKNYQTHFDFEQKKGAFKSNVGISKVEFPFNKYICSMDRFDWLIENEEIALSNEMNKSIMATDTMSLSNLIDAPSPGSEFISVHPRQDSLRFFALKARYNLRTNLISAEDVKLIRVADAAVFPDSGKVYILRNAEMKPLAKANIIANRANKYHNFYNANVTITSRKKYSATANYDYVENNGEHEMIAFNKIIVDTNGQTVAKGKIPEDAKFKLSPQFAFAGDVTLSSGDKNLKFDGGFQPVSNCPDVGGFWVAFESVIDPQNVQIPLNPDLRDIHLQKLALGVMFSNTTGTIYPALFTNRRSFSDSLMTTAEGKVDYSAQNKSFRISLPDNPQGNGTTGLNSMTFDDDNCVIHGRGRVSMGVNATPLGFQTYGTVNHFIIPDSTNTQLSLALDFAFTDDAMEKFRLALMSVNLDGMNIQKTPYYLAMQSVIPKKDLEKLDNEMSLTGKFRKFPDELNHTIFFGDVKFKYDSSSRTWVSYGPIGIASIGKNQVNRYVKGIIEFAKKRNGDDFTFLLQLTEHDWYYFNYRNRIMQAISSNLEFNDAVLNGVKSRTEEKKMDDFAKGYRYSIATDRKKRDFLNKYVEQ
jgi:hypothetical protein